MKVTIWCQNLVTEMGIFFPYKVGIHVLRVYFGAINLFTSKVSNNFLSNLVIKLSKFIFFGQFLIIKQ